MAATRWQYNEQRSPTTRIQEVAGFSASSRQTNYLPAPTVGVDAFDRPAADTTRTPATRHVKADL